jgi:hypothetical protein
LQLDQKRLNNKKKDLVLQRGNSASATPLLHFHAARLFFDPGFCRIEWVIKFEFSREEVNHVDTVP